MKSIVIIIDFDNFFGPDVTKINVEEVEFVFKEIINMCEMEFMNPGSIVIRLYGGWYQETALTKQASLIQQLLRNISVFPKVTESKVINGKIELATSLYSKPDFIWGYTHKETNGVKRIRLNHESVDTICKENRTNCPKYLLYKFTDSKNKQCYISGCMNIQKNVFKGAEQKMVDTLIACDIISTFEDEQISGVLVISDDQDHLPSLVQATLTSKITEKPMILALRNEKIKEFTSNLISSFNIKTTLVYDARRN